MTSPASLLQRRWIWSLPLVAAIVPLWMTFSFTTLMPRADQWGVVAGPFLKWQDGAPLWTVLHDQFNDSRHDAPKFIHLMIARFAGWDQTIEALVCTVLGILAAAMFLWMIARHRPGGAARAFLAACLAALLWLNAGQAMNWTWGVQICYMLMVCMVVATMAALQTAWAWWLRVFVAALCAFVACHSFMSGWLAWALGGAYLAWGVVVEKGASRERPAALLIWALLLALAAWIFFAGYRFQIAGQEQELARSPAEFARYLFLLAGAPLGKSWLLADRDLGTRISLAAAFVIGLMTLVMFVSLVVSGMKRDWKGQMREVLPFLLLALFGLAGSAAITLARTGSIGDPFQTRYLAITLWLHIGIVVLLGFAQGVAWRRIRAIWLVVVAHGCVTNALQGVDRAQRDYDDDRGLGAGFALRLVAPEPWWLDLLVPSGGAESLGMLARLEKLGCFQVSTIRSDRVADAPLESDAAQGAISSHRTDGGALVIEGWALMSGSRDSADAVVISVQPEGQEEVWFGIAQRRSRQNKLAAKLESSAFSNRIGWTYAHGAGLGTNLYGNQIRFRAKPMPAGKAVFRAYAFDVRRGKFTPLKGEVSLESRASK